MQTPTQVLKLIGFKRVDTGAGKACRLSVWGNDILVAQEAYPVTIEHYDGDWCDSGASLVGTRECANAREMLAYISEIVAATAA